MPSNDPSTLHGQALEPRKRAEIEHSRRRRQILQGQERHIDGHEATRPDDTEQLIRDKEGFGEHFSNMKFYSITHESEAYQHNWLRQRCSRGVRVLDFACGSGENGVFAAQCGADVIGIDISPEGVENANLNASGSGVSDHCKFMVMDGENMTFADDSFDVIVEYGALHHVDLEKAMAELARVLKPNGEMICIEALRHNPIIHWYRKRTPHLRTQWEVEHILGVEHLDLVREYFSSVDVRFFHLAALAAVPFRRTGLFMPLLRILNGIDRLLLSRHGIGKFAWIMLFTAGKPKKCH